MIIHDRNWDIEHSGYLAELHVARQELNAYAEHMSENFGSRCTSLAEYEENIPLDTDKFAAEVQKMMEEIYGKYLPEIERDRAAGCEENTD